MDRYSAERWMLDRHAAMVDAAERRARLQRESGAPLRAWVACSLRLLADRLEGASLAHPQRPTA